MSKASYLDWRVSVRYMHFHHSNTHDTSHPHLTLSARLGLAITLDHLHTPIRPHSFQDLSAHMRSVHQFIRVKTVKYDIDIDLVADDSFVGFYAVPRSQINDVCVRDDTPGR